jgi:hypothetical protein
LKGSGTSFSQNESGRIAAGARSRPSIVVTFPSLARVDDHEAPAADPGRKRLGDAEDCGRSHRRVDGVATASQRVDGSLRRKRVNGRCGAPGSRRRRRTVRARARQRTDL